MTSPLRILHTEASTGWGGQEIRILDEAAGLRARGHDVQIASPADAPIFEAAKRRQIPIHPVALNRRSVASVRAFARVIGQLKPQVIVTHSSSDSWIAAVATRLPSARTAIVRTRHLSTPVAPGILNRWLYGSVPARVVTTGEIIRKHLIERLGLNADKVVSVPTGADVSRFHSGDRAEVRKRLGLSGDEPIVGIVATLRSWKGHRFLVSAMGDPRLAAARLVIVGDGPQDKSLREQAAASSAASRVTFAGQQQDVAPWLQAFDVFALPSTGNEGVPQALMQAMAVGLPVVSTAAGAIPELVRNEETGLVVPTEDAAALAGAIARLIDDRELAARLGTAGRAHISKSFTSNAMLDRMEKILWQAVRESGPAG
jgi:glycosyltransferase involved in cell wall biosynthesis